jgi:heme-degrading monooxygenase HmoA
MITRIVKMTFRVDEIEAFLQLFEERKELIRNFEGCTHNPALFFTYSLWDSEEHLNQYRASHFFDDTWALTKQKFAAKPEAWTLEQRHIL